MDRITDLLAAGSCGINVELIDEAVSVDQVLENVLRHGAAADVAVADEKYFYHYCITSHFLVFLDISGFVSPCKFLLFGITWSIFA